MEQFLETRSVIFVEQTNGRELESKIKEQVQRFAPIVGFKVKVAERSGTNLKRLFPQGREFEDICFHKAGL